MCWWMKMICLGIRHGILQEGSVHIPITRLCPKRWQKWPMELFSRLLPRIYQIVEEINRRFVLELTEKYGNNPDKISKKWQSLQMGRFAWHFWQSSGVILSTG